MVNEELIAQTEKVLEECKKLVELRKKLGRGYSETLADTIRRCEKTIPIYRKELYVSR